MARSATFADRLKTALSLRNMTKAELSRRTGIDKSSLTRYTKGDWEGKQDAVYAIAQALDVSEAWLMGYDTDMERTDYTKLLAELSVENSSGRPAAIDEMRRLFGTEHSTLSTHICKDKKVAILYYKALERNVALSLYDIIDTVDKLDGHQAEKVALLLHAYLKAEQPIRNIVDTALDPYTEDMNELLCGDVQIG